MIRTSNDLSSVPSRVSHLKIEPRLGKHWAGHEGFLWLGRLKVAKVPKFSEAGVRMDREAWQKAKQDRAMGEGRRREPPPPAASNVFVVKLSANQTNPLSRLAAQQKLRTLLLTNTA